MLQRLANKRILLAVTGSVAAYKAAEIIRGLRQAGAQVRVIMTQGACEFVTPMTFQALSANPVHLHLLDTQAEAAMGHIELARWADALLVAPASANFLARLRSGRADDLLMAVCLASHIPLVVAPAMNQHMWADAATQDNIKTLQSRGILIFGPDTGEQACGDIGPGRMLEPQQILEQLADIFETGLLSGLKILISAGPTQEPIDPVRFISNRSSGKMGYAIAAAAVEAGAQVYLVSGPVSLSVPERVECIHVVSAQEMYSAVLQRSVDADIFIATAAVSDYRPAQYQSEKIKKSDADQTLLLTRNPDILAQIKAKRPELYCVGFAAETHNLHEHARAKLHGKKVDLIAANWVGPDAKDTAGTFNSDNNALHLFWRDREIELPVAAKAKIARELLTHIVQHYQATRVNTQGNGKIVSIKKGTGADSQ